MSHARTASTEAFALTSDPAAYVPSAERERALEQMTAALEAGAIPCLEGPTGIGKTLLLQVLARRLGDRFEPIYMPYPMLSAPELCQFALGLLERSYSGDAEAALLQLASERAARRRPLLLLIDDASSLPPDSACGLAVLRTQSNGALQLGFAGIGGRPLLEAMAPFGDTLLRVALDEGISEGGLRDYVVAQLDHANVSGRLRAAFDDEVLDELAREASGNPRRLHVAAQTILRRAEGGPPSGSPPPLLVEAEPSLPALEPTPPPPPRVEPSPPPIVQVALPPGPPAPPALPAPRPREVAPPPPPEEPALPAPASRSEPAAPPPGADEPIGEYRIVRRKPIEEPPTPAPTPPPLRPLARPPARHEIETPPRESVTTREPELMPIPPPRSERIAAAEVEASEPVVPLPRPPWESSAPAPAKAARASKPSKPVRRPRATERTPSFPLVIGVAVLSALIGFALASSLQSVSGRSAAPARPAASEPARATPAAPAPVPTPSARQIEEPPSAEPAEPAAPEASAPAPEPQTASNPVAPITPAPAPPEPQPAAAAPQPPAPPVPHIEVSINATPWAVIEVDGRELGETPLGGISLEQGAHQFVARFPNGRVVERKVEIDAAHRALVFE